MNAQRTQLMNASWNFRPDRFFGRLVLLLLLTLSASNAWAQLPASVLGSLTLQTKFGGESNRWATGVRAGGGRIFVFDTYNGALEARALGSGWPMEATVGQDIWFGVDELGSTAVSGRSTAWVSA